MYAYKHIIQRETPGGAQMCPALLMNFAKNARKYGQGNTWQHPALDIPSDISMKLWLPLVAEGWPASVDAVNAQMQATTG